jgi:dihydropyrimidine dehydrogenase (NAD+) subunit PreT
MNFSTRKSNKLDNLFDMEAPFTISQALTEASRCLLCYDAPCSRSCPADTDPGTFIRKFCLKNTKGAIRTIKENNILGGVCGVVCPTEKLCQEACSATEIAKPIEIGKLQRFLVEHGWDISFNPLERVPLRNKKVAIVGSGPAGLSCAGELAKTGFQVTVFEAREKVGGVLRYGVPEFRLNGEFLDREIKDITNLGVKIKCNSRITSGGVDNLLKKGFDAIFIATGLWNAYKLNIPGSNLTNVTDATAFLESARSKNRHLTTRLVKNNNVAVIGGGSVAMDVANTCKVLGAKKVYCICIESFAEIPAAKADLEMARDNFVIIKPQSQVTKILGNNGKVAGIKGTETDWIKPNLFIPSNAREVPGTEFNLKVKAVVMAIGSGSDAKVTDLCSSIRYKKNYLINIKKDGVSTADKAIFAGGDIVRGPALVVEAVADGKKAAKKIIEQLSQ